MQTCTGTIAAPAAQGQSVSTGEQDYLALFQAIALPCRILEIEDPGPSPTPLNKATAAICGAMLSLETPLWTDLPWRSQASYWLQYDCQSSIVSEPCMADYAVIASPHSMPALSQFRVCDGDSIATATTLIVQVPGFYPIFENCNSRRLRSTPVPSFPAGLPDDFWAQRLSLMRSDPRGLDIMFTHGRQMMFLPGNARIAY